MAKKEVYDINVKIPVGLQKATLYFEIEESVPTGKLVTEKGEFELKDDTYSEGTVKFMTKLMTRIKGGFHEKVTFLISDLFGL